MPLWTDIMLVEPVADDRIAAAIAEVFGVEAAGIRVFGPDEWPDQAVDAGLTVYVRRSPFRGDAALYLSIYPQFNLPPHDELAALKRLAQLLNVACMVNEHVPFPYDLRVWPDGHCDWVYLTNPVTDDEEDAAGDAASDDPEELVIFSIHGAPGLGQRPPSQGTLWKWRQFAVARNVSDDELRQAIGTVFNWDPADVAVVERMEELLKVPSSPHAGAGIAVLRWRLAGDFPLWVEVLPYYHDPYYEGNELEAVRLLARALGAPGLVAGDTPDPCSWFRVWGDGRLDQVMLDAAALDRDEFVIASAEPVVWQRTETAVPWESVYLARRVPHDRLATALAGVFGVEVAGVRVYGPEDVLAMHGDTGAEVTVGCFPQRGDLALSLHVWGRKEAPGPDGLAVAQWLSRTLETACVVGVSLAFGTRSGSCRLRVWPDGRMERVVFAQRHGIERDPPLTIAEVLPPPAMVSQAAS